MIYTCMYVYIVVLESSRLDAKFFLIGPPVPEKKSFERLYMYVHDDRGQNYNLPLKLKKTLVKVTNFSIQKDKTFVALK